MKVIAFNGSPRKNGNTADAVKLVLKPLEDAGVETETVTVGAFDIHGCKGCGWCKEHRGTAQGCVRNDDPVNGWIKKMAEADGILLASPTYYGNITGQMKCFLDRAFYYAAWGNDGMLRQKVGASVMVARRAGALDGLHQLNDYLMYNEMLVASSCYWNIIFGHRSGETAEDAEGRMVLTKLGENMLYLLRLRELGGDELRPAFVRKQNTNFIR
ncbi:MAG: flavodoxin family protein [Bacillota bacterium]|nr:flavodoxin family protein [Bacillota bacterium]